MLKSITPVTPKPNRLRFPRAARLRTSREFALVRKQGRTAQGRLLRISVVRMEEDSQPARFGIITSRKVGGAVDRNHTRRRLRELCRLSRPEVIAGWLVVVVAKSHAASASFSELREEWLQLARRLSIVPRFDDRTEKSN
ncbi:ribonuclease P protein component [Terrimicrobium sacchariphilum]|uniref:ribonuclease P protein component n=1 Tax=Terrimicrobium sacchariphilum TaxID=690879 RepID=UPI00350E4B5E